MKCKTKEKKGNVALKLDVSKAFDRIRWDYLEALLSKLGFDSKWVKWIMLCVSSVTYHVIVNHDCVGPITPQRGLRQGDSLSPYLYILCAQGYTSLTQKFENSDHIHGVSICRGSPSISHLLFADDSFLFCDSSLSEVSSLKNILQTYEEASGRAINLNKSAIAFSKNVSSSLKLDISNLLGVFTTIGEGKYLGLPSMVGRTKKAIFSYIKDRIWRKIQAWSHKSLSKARKEILIKYVAQAIPSYCMGAFLIPMTLGEDIERILNSFYWGSKKNGSRT